MAQLLSLSRAARLVGVTRGALQKKIKDGELTTFEGQVTTDDLLRTYPQAHLEDDSLLERLTRLKEDAYARRLRERILPDAEVLMVRVSELGRELAAARTGLAAIRSAMAGVERKLQTAAGAGNSEAQNLLAGLQEELRMAIDPVSKDSGHLLLAARDSFLRVLAAQVRVLPGQREFFVEGSDSLLDSALRAGLSLNYGCSNGNCGLCKARVVSGETKEIRHHDYVLSEREKDANTVLMCSHTAVTDLVIEAEETGDVREIPLQQIMTRVRKIERLTPTMTILHLQTPRTQRLRFLAGQYVTLQGDDGSRADYPIASCPCDDRNLQFHIQRMPDNSFAERVFEGLKAGDPVSLQGPRGDFVLNESSPRDLIFIAGDTGFAPIKSLIEHAMALDVAERISLYWITSPANGPYLANLCRAWADALDNFDFVPLEFPDRQEPAPGVLRRLLVGLESRRPAVADCDVYVAGDPVLAEAARGYFSEQGLPPEHLHIGYPR